MESLYAKPVERAVLVGLNADVFSKEETASDASLNELEALLQTAGGECVAKVLQNRHMPDPRSFIGEGKADEVKRILENEQAQMLIFDNDLTPSQVRALEEITGATVLDRSALILDIFAQRAQTREGRLQVELAQYQYLLPRLSGAGKSLSRLGGGIGTRGPGETKLETDRRHIRERIDRLRSELKEVRQVRAVQRERRIKNRMPVVALVGYTNAGKSTLLNILTDADIPANDRLFDTLDTTTRRLRISDSMEVLLSDTVGFISKLPHHLVEAFKATLEELEYADLLVHVIDSSDPQRQEHMKVVERLIAQLAKPGVPVITCYNKSDLELDTPWGEDIVCVSAKTGDGLDELLQLMEKRLNCGMYHVRFRLPYSMAGQIEILHSRAQVCACEYEADGICVEAICDEVLYGRLRRYVEEEYG